MTTNTTLALLAGTAILLACSPQTASTQEPAADTSAQSQPGIGPRNGMGPGQGRGMGMNANAKPDVAQPPEDAVDQREIIYLSSERRQHVLEEMQGFLAASQEIIAALGQNDMQAVQDIANGQRRGQGNPGLGVRFRVPETFFEMAQQTRQGFGRVADVARETGDVQKVNEELGNTMLMCNACHTTWQLREKN